MLISKRPQLVDNKVQRNRHQQVDDGRNGLADAEECNFNPEQHVGQNRRAAVTDIGLAQPLELAAPVIGVAGKDKFIIPEKCIGNAQNRAQDAADHIQVRADPQEDIVDRHGHSRVAYAHIAMLPYQALSFKLFQQLIRSF